jgi:hypothetical protein
MADDTEKLSLLEIAKLFQRHHVEYLVIGGLRNPTCVLSKV